MTAARLRASSHTCSSAAGRSSGQRSAREMPVSTRRSGPPRRPRPRPAPARRAGRCWPAAPRPRGPGPRRGSRAPAPRPRRRRRRRPAAWASPPPRARWRLRRRQSCDPAHRWDPRQRPAGRCPARRPDRPSAGSVAGGQPVQRPAPGRRRRVVGHRLLTERGGDGGGDVGRRGVGGQHVHHAELAEPGLGLLVARRAQPDDGDVGSSQPGQRVAVEAAELGRQQGGPRGAGGRGRQQVGEVDAAADHGDAGRRALEAGDQRGLPARAGDRGQDGDAHGLDDPAGAAPAGHLGDVDVAVGDGVDEVGHVRLVDQQRHPGLGPAAAEGAAAGLHVLADGHPGQHELRGRRRLAAAATRGTT